jgi:hypothetical protein
MMSDETMINKDITEQESTASAGQLDCRVMQQKKINYKEQNGKYIFHKEGVYFAMTKEQVAEFNTLCLEILGLQQVYKDMKKLAFLVSTDETQPDFRREFAKQLHENADV